LSFPLSKASVQYIRNASPAYDLFQNTLGFVMLLENKVEVSYVFIRCSGASSEDEPVGVQYLIAGLTLNQGDGEIILEGFDVSTFKCSEIYLRTNVLRLN
jgi:hypothetical protein